MRISKEKVEEFKTLLKFVEENMDDPKQSTDVKKAEIKLRKIWPDYKFKTLEAILIINGLNPDEFREKSLGTK